MRLTTLLWLALASSVSATWLRWSGNEQPTWLPKETSLAEGIPAENAWSPKPTPAPGSRSPEDRVLDLLRRDDGNSTAWENEHTCGWYAGVSSRPLTCPDEYSCRTENNVVACVSGTYSPFFSACIDYDGMQLGRCNSNAPGTGCCSESQNPHCGTYLWTEKTPRSMFKCFAQTTIIDMNDEPQFVIDASISSSISASQASESRASESRASESRASASRASASLASLTASISTSSTEPESQLTSGSQTNTPATTTSTSNGLVDQTNNNSKMSVVGAIIGGVLGGLALIILIILLLFCMRRKKTNKAKNVKNTKNMKETHQNETKNYNSIPLQNQNPPPPGGYMPPANRNWNLAYPVATNAKSVPEPSPYDHPANRPPSSQDSYMNHQYQYAAYPYPSAPVPDQTHPTALYNANSLWERSPMTTANNSPTHSPESQQAPYQQPQMTGSTVMSNGTTQLQQHDERGGAGGNDMRQYEAVELDGNGVPIPAANTGNQPEAAAAPRRYLLVPL